ncbi:MAG: lipoprotein insertase outer membrane protein LolB [Halioglobus sp.]
MRACASVLLALSILAGCAGNPERAPASGYWDDHRQHLETLGNWTAVGKVAVRDSEQSESATMKWQQSGATALINLSGPLGSGATRLHSDGSTLTIERGGDSRRVDISSAEAVRASTGWDLPLQVLPFWLRGVPFPGSAIEDIHHDADSGRLLTLRQDGWDIHYEAYAVFDGFTLPTKLRMQRGESRATVLVRRWQTGATP